MTAAPAAATRSGAARVLSGTCGTCRHFADSPRKVEERLPGLRALGSMDGSVRGVDGLCALHERYLAASSGCTSHEVRGPDRARR